MHPLEPDQPSSLLRSAVTISIKSLGTRDVLHYEHGNVGVALHHHLYAPLTFLLPFTIEEGIKIPEHWINVWNSLMVWPGNRDLSREQWMLLSQTLRIFYHFAHQEGETVAAWPSFMEAYLLLGEIGACFGRVMAGCGEIQLGFLIAWAGSRLPESLMPSSTLFRPPNEAGAAITVDSINQGNAEEDDSFGWHFV